MDMKTQWDGTARDLDRTKNRLAKAKYDLEQKSTTVSTDPAWYENKPAKRHAKAARAGWKKVAKPGWKPKSKAKRTTAKKSATKSSGTKTAKKSTAKKSTAKKSTVKKSVALKRGAGGRFTRDPAWFEAPPAERHSFAAEKGWRKVAKPGWVPKRVQPRPMVEVVESDMARRGPGGRFVRSNGRGRDPAWFEEKPAINHALAARTGWKKVAKKGWRPKHPKPFVPVRDPEHYGSRGRGRSRGKARGGMSYSRAIQDTY